VRVDVLNLFFNSIEKSYRTNLVEILGPHGGKFENP
jgi:hypothetical protein